MNPAEGNVTVVRLVQRSNVDVPSEVIDVALRSTDVMLALSMKVPKVPSVVSPLGNVSAPVRPVCLKALAPIDASDEGRKLSVVRLEHRKKQESEFI